MTLHGSGFAANADDHDHDLRPRGAASPTRTLSAQADALGAFDASFVADPDGNLDTHIVDGERRQRLGLDELPGRRATTTRPSTRRPATSSAPTGSR